MAEDIILKNGSKDEEATEASAGSANGKNHINFSKANVRDPEIFSCLLQPAPAESDPAYVGIRRLLLSHKAESGCYRRLVGLVYSFISFVSILLYVWI